jgi:Secretion system C-terminal sorting domain/Photosynthesis system II assembly factor YCF48
MKKYFHIVLFAAFVLSALGFRGCGVLADFIESLFYYHATGQFTLQEASGENEIYSIAVGEGGAIYTRAGRPPATWVESQSGITQRLNFVRVYSNPDSLIAYAVGDGGTVLLSRDKGFTWEDRSIPSLSANLYGVDFFSFGANGTDVVVCGDGGVVYKATSSGGTFNWEQINTPTTERLNTIGTITSDLYIAAGENGTIFKTNDGGQTWQDVGIPDPDADFNRLFLGVSVELYGHGWIVGDNGKIYMTTDYGNTWLPRESGTSENLYDITFKNPLEGVVAGANGVVRYTTDGGLTWHEDTYLSGLTTRDIVSISGVDENTASAITVSDYNGDSQGADTTFFLAVSSEPFVGVDDDENIAPTEFSLEQNYPNPFNPSTSIQDAISSRQFITLKVYDVLGNEVATLVNEEKPAGVYEVEFSAESATGRLTSGVYFYKLNAGSFTETKKLVLMK